MQRTFFITIASCLAIVCVTKARRDQRRLLLSDLDGTLVGGPGETSKVCCFNIPFATLLATNIPNKNTHTHTHTHLSHVKTLQSIERLRAFNKHWVQHEHPWGSILGYNTARCIKDYRYLLKTDQVGFWCQLCSILCYCSFGELLIFSAADVSKQPIHVMPTSREKNFWLRLFLLPEKGLRFGRGMETACMFAAVEWFVCVRAMVHASVI